MQPRPERSRLVLLLGITASLASALLVPLTAQAASPSKTTLCHRTSSHTNPYRRTTVGQSALTNANGHGRHTGPLWVEGGPKGWGDVIPGEEVGADPAHALNWPEQPGDSTWDAAPQVAWEVPVTAATSPPPVTRRPQAITFAAPGARPWTAETVSVAPHADSGLSVALSSLTTGVCTTDGLRVTVRDVGQCRLAADQAGDEEVLPALRVVAELDVLRAPQEVVFGAPALSSHPVGSVDLGATATSGLPVDLSADPAHEAVCAVSGAVLQLRRAGACSVTGTQAGDERWTPAPPLTRTFTATPVAAPVVPRVPPTPPSPPAPEAPVVPVPPVQRVEGRERTETSARLALSMYPQPRTARVVVLARSDVYADGLTGSPLAGTLDGPVLLTAPDRLPAATAAAIRSVLAADGTVVVLGGVRAVTPAVVEQVRRLGYRSERIGGVDRYDTATLIADRIDRTTSVGQVYLATGTSFPDACRRPARPR